MFYIDIAQAARRPIPWDCSDWQASPAVADADDARVSSILESLGVNRGKTIYCAIDQSDTFTKAETWAAGRHRNERDDTVYFGQSGNFRGFLSAQENYLTDGESGVSGQSIDRIFEFPEEPRRKRKKRKRVRYVNVIETLELAADPGRLVESHRGCWPSNWFSPSARASAEAAARHILCYGAHPDNSQWLTWARPVAQAECIAQGYQRAQSGAATVAPGTPDWRYEQQTGLGGAGIKLRARQVRQYTATCERTVRRRATADDP